MSTTKEDVKKAIESTITLTKAFDAAKKRNLKINVPISKQPDPKVAGKHKKLTTSVADTILAACPTPRNADEPTFDFYIADHWVRTETAKPKARPKTAK
jgi:hypothetical protein